jgi:hypothetical protein
MSERSCPACGGRLPESGIFCPRGHAVSAQPADDLQALRAEVDRAFEEARLEVTHVLAPAAREAAAPPGVEEAPAPPTAPQAAPPAEATRPPRRVPPPPPPPARTGLYDALASSPPDATGDPIQAFSPPAVMDWGPRRAGILRRRWWS